MPQCYDRRYFAFFGFWFFCVFLFFLGMDGYQRYAVLATPAVFATLVLLIFIPRDVEKVPEAYRLASRRDIFKALLGRI
ncbi:hypothetical protein [Allorhodopirellula heiligendammensis]|uniref:Uncharacterized protein n=1 Tax=Allorhodopirellula heiligendammensis TaxID=2714739 RepID=A0A5C6BWQ7_9BACT|nr:hypothetical protein [Allorhodopirellula heiligendammensis]TWU16067.1 hypothetical protein Poly21_32720 [Allorhodopirellula heiligendammensis]